MQKLLIFCGEMPKGSNTYTARCLYPSSINLFLSYSTTALGVALWLNSQTVTNNQQADSGINQNAVPIPALFAAKMVW